MRSDRERLLDVVEAIEAIGRHSGGGRAAFAADELVQVWMVHHIQIVGEASAGLSLGLRAAHPEVPWRQIIDMRNLVVHGYASVDPEIVWAVVEHDLPVLEAQVRAILEELPS